MAQVASTATKKLAAILAADSGMPASVSIVADLLGTKMPPFNAHHVVEQNAPPDIAEKSEPLKYPMVYVYCSKVSNSLREKFRTFSGEAEVTIEVRVSHDRVNGIEQHTEFFADAATYVLDQNRGDWGDGYYYTGGYEVSFGPVKHGGSNFIQIAKISCNIQVSAND